MRVRMLKAHEIATTVPGDGAVTLVFPAGSTQYFDDAQAAALVADGIAAAQPEAAERVRMLRTMTEAEIAAREGRPAASGSEAVRFGKGDLVHFPPATVAALIAGDEPVAELVPDPDYDPIAATHAAAVDAAVARKREQAEADARRAAIAASVARARATVTPTPVPSSPSTPITSSAATPSDQ